MVSRCRANSRQRTAPIPSQIQPRRCRLLIFSVLALVLAPAIVRGQSYLQTVGSPSFTTKIPVENGWIDASNGRLHLEFPIATSPERAGKTYSFSQIYDSNIWTSSSGTWQPNNAGWTTIDSSLGSLSFSSYYSKTTCAEWNGPKWLIYNNWTFTGPDGTLHRFPVTIYENLTQGYCPGRDTPVVKVFAADASGYYIDIEDYSDATVYGPDGTKYEYGYGQGSRVGKDSNGNTVAPLVGGFSPTVNGNVTTYSGPNAQGGTRAC